MSDLEHVKFLDRMIERGGDKRDKVETYIKYLKYTEAYDETGKNFKKLFEPNVLALILDGKCTFLDAYITLSKVNLHEKKGAKAKEKDSSSSYSSDACHSSKSSSSCHSSSSSSCHSSSSSSSCSSTGRSSCYSTFRC